MKTALVLGAGLVTRPLVRYLLDAPDIKVIVASRTLSKAEALIDAHPQGEARELNVQDIEALRAIMPDADLVISLLPYIYHVQVAELCIEFGKDMVTTSYVSPGMWELDDRARAADIILLNEIGVDPGIDHMSAMQIIDDVHRKGGEITSFRSWCGGLPAPEANTNPFGYKFSWSPRGVLYCWLVGTRPIIWRMDRRLRYQERIFLTATGRWRCRVQRNLKVIRTATRCLTLRCMVFRTRRRYSAEPYVLRVGPPP